MQTKKLPLYTLHASLGAKFGTFGEWEVPLYYSSVIEEHETVRNAVGIFDISHMGEIYFEGKGARSALNYLVTNKIDRLVDGKAIYSPVCNEQGGIVDDVIVYQLNPESYLVIVNAANIEKDYRWFKQWGQNPREKGSDPIVSNRSDEFGLLSIQGPKSLELLKQIVKEPVDKLSYYAIMPAPSLSKEAQIARTGYTGELGYEILIEKSRLEALCAQIFSAGKQFGLKPIGFGARDTLRLEACMLLYGQDMNDETTPLEAGLERTVFFEKEFVGREALLQQKQNGISKKLVGFEMEGRAPARHGYPVLVNGKQAGEVTSGSFSPTLKKSIGLAYLPASNSDIDVRIEVQVRQTRAAAKIVATPFYKKPGNKL